MCNKAFSRCPGQQIPSQTQSLSISVSPSFLEREQHVAHNVQVINPPTSAGEQQVFWFEISVSNLSLVQELHCVADLLHYFSCVWMMEMVIDSKFNSSNLEILYSTQGIGVGFWEIKVDV